MADFDLQSLLQQAAQGKVTGTTDGPGSGGLNFGAPVALHATPDGGMTTLSDSDYAAMKQSQSHPLPQVNLPQITTGADPSQSQGSAGTGILALPAPGSPNRPVIDVDQAKAVPASPPVPAPAAVVPSSAAFDVEHALHQTTQGKLEVPATPPAPAPQMTGVLREPALAGSNLAKSLVSLAGLPGDVARGVTALGGAQAAGELQGNPLPSPPTFAEPGQFQPLQAMTPQMLAAAPGKQEITPPSGHNPLDTETLLGLTHAAGITDRPDLQAQGLGENLLAGGAQGVGMVLPSLLTGGTSNIGAAARLLRQGAAMGIGAQSGGDLGEAIGSAVGHPDAGRLIGGTVGSVVPTLGAQLAMRGLNTAQRFTVPVSKNARQMAAARTFAPANTPEVRAAVANPKELVPGSPATPFQLTGNPFLGAQEKNLANQPAYKPAFTALKQEQATKQVAAIQGAAPKDADAGGVVPWFKSRLKALHDAEKMDVGNQRAVTQDAVDAMGNPIAPHEAGAVVGNAVENARSPQIGKYDRAIQAVEQKVQSAWAGLGGAPVENAVQKHGARMRGEPETPGGPEGGLLAARTPVHAAASEMFDAFNKDRKLALDVSGVGESARTLLKELNPRMAGRLEPEEAPVLQVASGLRGVELLSDLDDLRSVTSDALRAIEERLGDKSRAYRRMSILLSSMEDTLAKAAGEAAQADGGVAGRFASMAQEDIHGPVNGGPDRGGAENPSGGTAVGVPGEGGAAVEGAERPGTAQSPGPVAIAQPTGRLESLVDFVISKGGVRDDRGDLRAADLQLVHHRAGGRLLNPKGLPADDMARLARDAGYPTEDLNQFKDELSSAAPIYKTSEAAEASINAQRVREAAQEQHERMMAAANVDEATSALGVRLSPAEHTHATELALHGAHPEEAVQQAVRSGEETILQGNAEHNAVGAPGVPLAAQQAEMPVERSQLQPNFTPEAQQALRQRNAAWADYKERFGKGAVGNVLQSSSKVPGGYKIPDSMVPSALFAPGRKGAEAADSLIAAMGSKDAALQVLGDYPAYSLRQAASEMGKVNLEKYDAWVVNHQAVLDKFPQLKASFDTVAKAQAVLDDLKAQRAALDAANPLKGAADNVSALDRYVVKGPKGYEAADRLIRDTNGSPEALAAVRDHLASTLRSRAERTSSLGSDAGTLEPGGYRSFMRDYEGFLSHPAMAETRAAFGDAAKAQQQLDAVAAHHMEMRDEYLTSVARHYLREDADPVIATDKILSSRDPGIDLADLGRQTSDDPVAREAIQKAVIEAILKKVSSNNLIGEDLTQTSLRNEQTQNLIGKLVGDNLDGPLRHVMTPAQMKALGDVRMDIRRSNMVASGPRNTEGSATSFLHSAREADAHEASPATTLGLMEMMGEVGEKFFDSKWGRALGVVLIPAYNLAHRAGFRSVNDLRAEAILHPDKLSSLLEKLPTTPAEATSRTTAITNQLTAWTREAASSRPVRYAPVSGARAANENDYAPQKAAR